MLRGWSLSRKPDLSGGSGVGWSGLIANTQTRETDLSFEQKIAEHTLSGEEFYSVDEMGLFRKDLLGSFL